MPQLCHSGLDPESLRFKLPPMFITIYIRAVIGRPKVILRARFNPCICCSGYVKMQLQQKNSSDRDVLRARHGECRDSKASPSTHRHSVCHYALIV